VQALNEQIIAARRSTSSTKTVPPDNPLRQVDPPA
jgi:hypothetical protein